MPDHPAILARGPWTPESVEARWLAEPYRAQPAQDAAADEAIRALRDRGSPSHDGVAARLAAHRVTADGRLVMELQPVRWALRLVPGDAADSLSALCVTRDCEGRWLAGRRAQWLSTWAGVWALGAGGAVDPDENPIDTLVRELDEEWSVRPEQVTGEALIGLPQRMAMFVGMAWLPPGAEVTPDDEHDAYDWWPADPVDWPDEAHPQLRAMASMLAAGR
jgi:ADP-ribose pyrophosphatase YjhB (NUDIX family)